VQMPISNLAMEYLQLWEEDLRVKGFKGVELRPGNFPFLTAIRPDGRKFYGFAAFEPEEVDIRLRQAIEDAVEQNSIVFLVTPFNMTEATRLALGVWGLDNKVNVESVL